MPHVVKELSTETLRGARPFQTGSRSRIFGSFATVSAFTCKHTWEGLGDIVVYSDAM